MGVRREMEEGQQMESGVKGGRNAKVETQTNQVERRDGIDIE